MGNPFDESELIKENMELKERIKQQQRTICGLQFLLDGMEKDDVNDTGGVSRELDESRLTDFQREILSDARAFVPLETTAERLHTTINTIKQARHRLRLKGFDK